MDQEYRWRRPVGYRDSQHTLKENMFREYDVVELAEDLSDSLKAGTRGAIVMVYSGERPAYEVEFVDANGRTIEVRTVLPDRIRLATGRAQ